jgi:hypothetical protein
MRFDEELTARIEAAMARPASTLLSIEQLAARLAVSVRTVRRMHAAGKGPPRARRGHALMYRSDDVEAWFAATGRERTE